VVRSDPNVVRGHTSRSATSAWRTLAAVAVLGVWALVSVGQLSRLSEPAPVSPGAVVVPSLGFFRAQVPDDAAYLYVLSGDNGSDTGAGLRLRYELFPRFYENARVSDDEASVRTLMRNRGIRYIVVPYASAYPPTLWLRQERPWFRRVQLDRGDYVLVADP
jgi:hypothetical protein